MASWPEPFFRHLAGIDCPLCAEGRPDEVAGRIRFFSSSWSDAYLHTHGVQRGYTAVIWRGRHVAEPTELSAYEATAFWFDVLQVGQALQDVYQPMKMNYQLLGNRIPHLHCLLAPRFREDVAPGDPLPAHGYHAFSEDAVMRDVEQLRNQLSKRSSGAQSPKDRNEPAQTLLEELRHRWRAPLSSARGFVEVLQNATVGTLNADQKELLESLAKKLDEMHAAYAFLNVVLDQQECGD